MQEVLIGQCFRIETAWGDESPPWYVYRRVRRVMARMAECHRFEVRSPQLALGGGPMYVWYPQDVIAVRLLLGQELLMGATWQGEWDEFVRAVQEPWNVE